MGFVVSSRTRGSFISLYYDPHKPQFVSSMQCTRIVKLKHTHTWFEGIRLTNIIGPIKNDVFVDSKINNKSQNTRIPLLIVERFDLYMK